jgi:hypothetical protein
MSASLLRLIADLKYFEDRKLVLKEFKNEVRKPVPAVRKAIRARAKSILPHSGGLGDWVSRIRINVKFKLSSRSAGITLQGGRNSSGGRSDINAIDRGRVRAPTFGRRGHGQWHTQQVSSGFFTDPVEETQGWTEAAEAAVDKALEVIRHG